MLGMLGGWGSNHAVITGRSEPQSIARPPRSPACRFYIDTPPRWTQYLHRANGSQGVNWKGLVEIPNTTYYDLQQRSLEKFVFHYLWRHPWRTFTERSASIVFVPSIMTCDSYGDDEAATRQPCRDALLDTKNRSVATHGANASFSIYSRPNRFYYARKRHKRMVKRDTGIKATVEAFKTQGQHPPWVAIPYLTNYLHRNGRFARPAIAAGLHDAPRKWLVSAIFGVRGGSSSRAIRNRVIRDCKAREKLCVVRSGAGVSASFEHHVRRGSSFRDAMALYADSVFTFQPQGDSYARKGLFDSLSQGAIPAIFHPRTFHYPVFFPQPYNSLVVLLDPTFDVVDQLLRIPKRDIKRMQRNIREHFHKFFYRDYRWSTPMVSYGGGRGRRRKEEQRLWVDALEHFLLHVCERAAGEPTPEGYGEQPKHPGFLFVPKREGEPPPTE